MFRAGDSIGPYKLIKKLGRGGFGEVWLAEEQDAIMASQVALKILIGEDPDLDAVKQEAAVWIQASGHPNVLLIIKAAQYGSDLVIVSEFAPDGSLKDWLHRHGGKAPSIKEAIRITNGILDGLEHLHARRIIHRDIKPDNVLMQGKTPRLADFGISRVMHSTAHSQVMAGTPSYMAPEAFRKERDEQTDIWAVGVLLYQMVSGRLPFVQKDLYLLMNEIVNDEPPELAATVPEPLQRVITTALQKEQAARYKTAREMREALQEAEQRLNEANRQKQEQEKNTISEARLQKTLPTRVRPPKPNLVIVPIQPQQFALAQPSLMQSAPIMLGEKQPSRLPLLTGAGLLLLITVIVIAVLSNKTIDSTSQSVIKDLESQMVQIQGGTFLMGSPNNEAGRVDDEGPQHRVTVSPFYMGKYEVTQAQWKAVAQLPKVKIDLSADPSNFKDDNLPVEQVSWEDAVEFCERLSQATGKKYRLPTEAEWEYACRAGTMGAYADNVDDMAWYDKNSGGKTHPVGQKKANAWDLYDMHGNVWEWCSDWYDGNYYKQSPNTDPAGPSNGSYRVDRGGSWNDQAVYLRSAERLRGTPDGRGRRLGCRLSRTYP